MYIYKSILCFFQALVLKKSEIKAAHGNRGVATQIPREGVGNLILYETTLK